MHHAVHPHERRRRVVVGDGWNGTSPESGDSGRETRAGGRASPAPFFDVLSDDLVRQTLLWVEGFALPKMRTVDRRFRALCVDDSFWEQVARTHKHPTKPPRRTWFYHCARCSSEFYAVWTDNQMKVASRFGHVKTVRRFLACGADVHSEDDEALRYASSVGHDEVVRLLLEHGANVHAKNGDALKRATVLGNGRTVRVLRKYGGVLKNWT